MQDAFDLAMLVVAPHPDDAELFCGGLILSMTSRGHKVGIVDLSLAELSTFGSVEQRTAETEKASRLLGIAWRDNLKLPNCFFHEHSQTVAANGETSTAVDSLVRAFRLTRPEVLVLPYQCDRHPDHVSAAHLAMRAVFLAGLARYTTVELPAVCPRQIIFYPFRTEFRPSFVVDITPFIERKYEVIRCYESQLVPPRDSRDSTLLSSPLSLDALRARDAHVGGFIGAAYGEAYLSQTTIRIDDLVAHVRSNPTDKALFFGGEH